MAVDVTNLAVALRVIADPTTALLPAEGQVLGRLLAVSQALVSVYASEGTPEQVTDQAVVLVASYLYDQPASARSTSFSTAWVSSGAQAITEPWRQRRAGLLEPGAAGPAPVAPGQGVDRAQVLALIANWAEQGNTEAIPLSKLANVPAGQGGDGLNLAQVLAQIADWAEEGNAEAIPASKLVNAPSGAAGLDLAQVLAQIADWAEEGNAQQIPASKLANAPSGASSGISLDRVKPFARTLAPFASPVYPFPADLASTPEAGQVLGLRTQGGVLFTNWNTLSQGSPHFVIDTVPTPAQIAAGGLAPAGGVVLVRETANHPTQLWVRVSPAFALVLFHTFADPLVKPLADGTLPPAADYQGREAIAGNQLLRSELDNIARNVVLGEYSSTRTDRINDVPRTADELRFAGSFASPPSGHYVLNAWAWDYGSEVWLQNQTANDNDWASSRGPAAYRTGDLYATRKDAVSHIHGSGAEELGRIVIYGHGAAQKPYVVLGAGGASATWRWVPIGLTLKDITRQVSEHNQDATAHPAIRAMIATGTAGGVHISAYEAAGTYSRGSANSIVTHGSGLFIYVSGVERSTNHDPGLFPGYWFELSEGAAYQIIPESGAVRIAARTLCVFAQNDQTYLCTTSQHTPRDQAHIEANSGLGQEFIPMNRPVSLVGLPRVREFNNATRGEVRSKGDIDEYNAAWYVSSINHTPGISPSSVPGVNDDFIRIDNVPVAVPDQVETLVSTGVFDSPQNTFNFPAADVASFRSKWRNTDYNWLIVEFTWLTGAIQNISFATLPLRPKNLDNNTSYQWSASVRGNTTPVFGGILVRWNGTSSPKKLSVNSNAIFSASTTCKLYMVS